MFLSFELLAGPAQGEAPGAMLALPFSRGAQIYTTRSTGQGKAAFYVQDGPNGQPKMILDSTQDPYLPRFPINEFSLSDDGSYLAYFVPQIPRRFEEIRVLDLKTGKLTADDLKWTYFSDLSWHGKGFYYGRYPEPKDLTTPDPADHQNEKLYYHRLGAPISADQLVYEDPQHPDQKYLYLGGFDRRWIHIHILPSLSFKSPGASEWFCRSGKGKFNLKAIQPTAAPGRFFSCDDYGDTFLMHTTYHSPNGRVVLIDSNNPTEPNWKTIIPETSEELTGADPAAGHLILTYKLKGGGTRIEIHKPNGQLEGLLPLDPGVEAEAQWSGPREKQIFYSVRRNAQAPSYYRYDFAAKRSIPFN